MVSHDTTPVEELTVAPECVGDDSVKLKVAPDVPIPIVVTGIFNVSPLVYSN